MPINVRDILLPFATDMGSAKIHRLDWLKENDVLLHMSITKVTGVIYDDGNHSISVPSWSYNSTASVNEGAADFPSTGLVVRKDQMVRVDWHNDVDKNDAESPVDEVSIEYNDGDNLVPQNTLGTNNAEINAHKAQARFVTHLHGGRVAPSYDGWPESVAGPKQTLRDCYENKERATMHWFHDHAMHTTASNVFAGLAAPYIIRDAEEHSLNLPSSDDELVLVIQDRNLSADLVEVEAKFAELGGSLETRLLRKIEKGDGPLEFFGPLTLVNGKIWPRKSVSAKWLRVRILNGSNSRTYALQFVKTDSDGQVATNQIEGNYNQAVEREAVPVLQIGSDGGLLDKSIILEDPIVLMPAQRIDLLVDLRGYADKKLALINLATAPFGGELRQLDNAYPNNPENDIDGLDASGKPKSPSRTPYPEVMRFDVQKLENQGQDYADIDARLSKCVNLSGQLPNPEHVTVERVIALVEKDMGKDEAGMDRPAMLVTLELIPETSLSSYSDKNSPEPPYLALHATHRVEININGEKVGYRVCAERFQDPVNFQIKYGATERWRFINLSPDSHPMHLHLVQFLHEKTTKVSTVEGIDLKTGDTTVSQSDEKFTDRLADFVNGSLLKDISLGVTLEDVGTMETMNILRDTVRVDPGTMVDIVARFEGYHGRYLYHCHLLEHEDHDMMRQYIVTRNDLNMHGLGGHIVPIMGSIGK